MKRKYILISIPVLLIISCAIIACIWEKPVHKIENETGILLSIDKLCQDFANNEPMADSLYLNKAIQVKGKIADLTNTLNGDTMMVFTASNNLDDVQCTLREKAAGLKVGATIIVKGFCSGKTMTGVSLTDCIIVP